MIDLDCTRDGVFGFHGEASKVVRLAAYLDSLDSVPGTFRGRDALPSPDPCGAAVGLFSSKCCGWCSSRSRKPTYTSPPGSLRAAPLSRQEKLPKTRRGTETRGTHSQPLGHASMRTTTVTAAELGAFFGKRCLL